MKQRVSLMIAIALLTGWSLPVQAFNGDRGGFILGLGAGLGQAKWTAETTSGGVTGSVSTDWSGLSTDFKIGGGINEQWLLYWSARQVFFDEDGSFAQGMGGIGASYFLNPQAPGFFFSGVLGLGSVMDIEGGDSESGGGLTIGVGYEFSPHWVTELNFMSAKIAEWGPAELTISNIMFTISWIGY